MEQRRHRSTWIRGLEERSEAQEEHHDHQLEVAEGMQSNRSHSQLGHQEVEGELVVAMARHLQGLHQGPHSFLGASRIRNFRHQLPGLVPMGQHRCDHGIRSRRVCHAAPVHVAAKERRLKLEREAHVVARVCN